MTFTELESEARALWDATPILQYGFADFDAFLQTRAHWVKDSTWTPAGTLDAMTAAVTQAAERAVERIRLVRDPMLAPVQMQLAERKGKRLTIWLYGRLTDEKAISGECSGSAIVQAIKDNADAQCLLFRISSSGGYIEEMSSIQQAIRDFRGRSVALVDHFAFSAASGIAITCDRLVMRRNSLLMFHRARTTATGHCEVLRNEIRTLTMLDFAYRKNVLRRIPRRHHAAVVDAIYEERYMGAEEAHALGLCDAITSSLLGSEDLIAAALPR